jgi:hypothetical protein
MSKNIRQPADAAPRTQPPKQCGVLPGNPTGLRHRSPGRHPTTATRMGPTASTSLHAASGNPRRLFVDIDQAVEPTSLGLLRRRGICLGPSMSACGADRYVLPCPWAFAGYSVGDLMRGEPRPIADSAGWRDRITSSWSSGGAYRQNAPPPTTTLRSSRATATRFTIRRARPSMASPSG